MAAGNSKYMLICVSFAWALDNNKITTVIPMFFSMNITIGHASGNENISFDPLFMIHNDVIGHLKRHFSMENHYKLS